MDSSSFTTVTAVLYQYIGITLYIAGNIGNIFTVLIFSLRTWRKNVCVFYFLICLLLEFIYINSTVLGSIVIVGFSINLVDSNVMFCKVYNYLTLFLSTLLPTILILVSIDRLLISSQNVETRLYSSKRLAYFLISISTVFWSIFFVHVLIKFDLRPFGPVGSICLFNTMELYGNFLTYSTLILNILSFVLMIVLSVLSFQNVRHIRSISRQERPTGRTMHKKDFQLLRCLFAKDIIYIICNTFLCIYFIDKVVPKSRTQTSWDEELSTFIFYVSSLIHHIPSCLSFYTYLVLSKTFRQSFKRMIWKIVGKDSTIIREAEQNG